MNQSFNPFVLFNQDCLIFCMRAAISSFNLVWFCRSSELNFSVFQRFTPAGTHTDCNCVFLVVSLLLMCVFLVRRQLQNDNKVRRACVRVCVRARACVYVAGREGRG